MAIKHVSTENRRRETKADPPDLRICKSCQTSKPLDEFRKSYQCRHGRGYTCFTCAKLQNRRPKKTGYCRVCNKEIQASAQQCPECLESQNTRQLQLYNSRRDSGLCIHCGKTEPAHGRYSCLGCLGKMKLRAERIRIRRVEKGLCYRCGHAGTVEPVVRKTVKCSRYRYCEDCYFRQAAIKAFGVSKHWRLLRDRWHDQAGMCPYTGELMI